MHSVFLGIAAFGCPLGMGLMMWFMGKGMRARPERPPATGEVSVEDLRVEQQRLAAEIDRLETPRVVAGGSGEANLPARLDDLKPTTPHRR